MKETTVSQRVSGRELAQRKPLQIAADQALQAYESLPSLGVHGFQAVMDTALTGPAARSGAALQQFLQVWLPGMVRQLTTVRAIDRIVGVTAAGNWYDDTVVQRVSTPVAKAELYGDSSNIPLASYGHTYATRGIVRFEQGFQVSMLEDAREGAGGISMAAEKRGAAMLALDIARNRAGFVGFAGGAAGVYGLLNDPGLAAYATTAGSKTYAAMTFDELTTEMATRLGAIMTNSGGNVEQNSAFTIVLPVGYSTIMTKPNTYGQTPLAWLNANYPNVRIEYVPEFTAANGGANVAYYFAERIEDGSTDGGNAIEQIVPAKMFNIGSERRAKGYVEDFGSATAGVMVKRPYLFVRVTGV